MRAAKTLLRNQGKNLGRREEPQPSEEPFRNSFGSTVLNLFIAGFLIISPCFLVLPLISPETRTRTLLNPALRPQDALHLLILAPVLLAALIVYTDALRSGASGFTATIRRTNRTYALLAAAPCIGALLAPAIESKHPHFTFLLIVLAALAVSVSAYSLNKSQSTSSLTSPLLSLPLILLATAASAAALSVFAVRNVRGLNMSSTDLAIFNNFLWNSSYGDFFRTTLARGQTHLSAHCDPLLILFAPLYRLSPGPEALVVFQAIWLCSGALPLYLLARRITPGRLAPAAIVLAFLLHPALHGMALFEFHSLALVTPLIIWLLWAVEAGRRALYWFFLVLVLLTREDMALLSCGVGFFLLFHDSTPRRGLLTIAISLVYLAVVKFFVMADSGLFMAESETSYGYVNNFSKMIPDPESGARGFLLSLITNPTFALYYATRPEKLQYAAVMLLPFGLLPLLSGSRLILCAYGAVFTMLATAYYFYSPYFQYAATLLPFLAALAPFGTSRLVALLEATCALEPKRLERGISTFILVAALGVSWKFGAFTENTNFRAGVREPVHWDFDDSYRATYDSLQAAVSLIPAEASVSATQYLLPYVSTRANVYTFNVRGADFYLFQEGGAHRSEKEYLEGLFKGGILEEVPVFKQNEIVVYKRK